VSSAVNPLGGTMVADAGAFGGGFPAGAPVPPPPAGGGSFDIGAPPPGFGAAPQGGFGAPPPGFGAPQAAPSGFESTMPVGGDGLAPLAPSPGAGMDVHPGAGMAPADDYQPIPGTVGGSNPIVTVLLIVFTFGIYGIYLLIKGKKQQSG
jgi:hypothetical protein